MRRPLPRDAPRRPRRALLLLLPVASAVVMVRADASSASSSPASSSASSSCSLADALSSQGCGAGCDGLCVHRAACAVDCAPTAAASVAVAWLDGGLAVSSSTDSATSTTVLHGAVRRIDDQLAVPANATHFSLSGPSSSASLLDLPLSNASRASFGNLQTLNLSHVNISRWSALPAMPELQHLALDDVVLTWWPLTSSAFSSLESLSLDNNRLTDVLDKVDSLPSTLRSLSLRSTGISRVPSSVANLTTLHDLFLDGNKLVENGTASMPGFLWTLSLRDCGLLRIPDTVNRQLALTKLDVSRNPDITSIPDNISALPASLSDLRLAACGLTEFPAVLTTRPQLTTLDLSFNALRDDDRNLSAQLSFLGKLSTLDLSATGRTQVPSAIANLTVLKDLSLASNSISTVDAASLPSSLEHLNVAYNADPLTLSVSSTVATQLLSLNVSHCGLTSLSISNEPLRKLQTLDASGNALMAADALPASLRFVNLSNNHLKTLPNALFQLTSLQQLDLRGNPIPKGAVPFLSSTQVAFLDGLQVLYVDPAVFQSTNCSAPATPTDFSFGYTVCAPPSQRGGSTTGDDPEAAAAARARMNRNLYIIAGTIGSALVAVTLASLAMRRRGTRRDAQKRRLMDADGAWPTELASDREMTDAEWRALQMWSFWDDEDVLRLRIPWDLVRDRQVIGSGQYSVLWLARVTAQPVFLKALQPTAHRHRDGDGEGSVAAVASLIREIQLLRALRHASIVRLVGVTWMNAPTDVQVAIEDMANGDLRGYLELTQPPAPPSRWRGDGFSLRVALQVADALVFLHRCGVAHNDLRSRNVVLDDDCNAKLTGFGRHVFVEPVHDGSDADDDGNKYMADAVANAVAATAARDEGVPPPSVDNAFLLDAGRWMAPEVLRCHLRGRQRHADDSNPKTKRRRRRAGTATTATVAASTAADVYALGVLLLELDCFEMPFARVDTEDDLIEEDSPDDDDMAFRGVQRRRDAPGPHDANDLRFSSMPSHHNSLLGGPPPHLTFAATDISGKPPLGLDDEDEEKLDDLHMQAPPGATMSAGEEKCELALLRRLADGVASQVELSPTCPPSIADVILQCLQLRPERRPTVRAVRDALRAIAAQRRRSSTGSSAATAAATNTSRSISSSQRSLLHTTSGGERDGVVAVAVATQTVDEEQAFVDGSSSADSDATTAFFVMQQSPARRTVTPP